MNKSPRSGRPNKGHKLWGGLLLLSVACSAPQPYKVDMAFQVTNTADHILVVEGETNLPAGSPLKAELATRDGQVKLRDSSVVSHGKFFFDFDLAGLDGLSLYQVIVRFDPQSAPLGVRQTTGMFGEALEGSGIKEVDSRKVLERKLEVILTAGGGDEDWEGRDFAGMDVSERARLIAQLEKVVEEKPEDRSAKLALARAYIADDPRELSRGTRAFGLLKEVSSRSEADPLSTQAGKMVAGIEGEEAKAKAKTEQREKISRGDKYKQDKTIRPGDSMGGFKLGASYRILKRHLKLKKPPDFSDPDVWAEVQPTEYPGLTLYFDSRTQRLVAARTTSEGYRLPERFGVGNLLQELQATYGKDAVPTPKFVYKGTRPSGHTVFRGTTVADGLEFEIVRTVDPVFGLPVDTVEAVSIFKGS